MIWLDALKSHAGAIDDYRAHLEKLRAQAQQEQDRALAEGHLGKAQIELGTKNILDILINDLTRSEREEAAYAGYRRNTR